MVDTFRAGGLYRLPVFAGLLGEDQPIATAVQAIERRARAVPIETTAQEPCPVVRQHCIQRIDYVLECIGDGHEAPVFDAKESACKIVERAFARRLFADQGVRIEPDERPLGIVVLEALPIWPGLRASGAYNFVVGGVLNRAPAPSR